MKHRNFTYYHGRYSSHQNHIILCDQLSLNHTTLCEHAYYTGRTPSFLELWFQKLKGERKKKVQRVAVTEWQFIIYTNGAHCTVLR